jgi:hypothetical protein
MRSVDVTKMREPKKNSRSWDIRIGDITTKYKETVRGSLSVMGKREYLTAQSANSEDARSVARSLVGTVERECVVYWY